MDKKEALKILYNRVMDNFFSYSGNYLMTIPKKGCEKAWQREKDLADVITELMNEGAN